MEQVTLLTGGGDRQYMVGLATILLENGVSLDIIGSDELDGPEWQGKPGVRFLNLRGDQAPSAPWKVKISRVLIYYARLIRYAWTARPRTFHILWNNKFESFDRTLLMLYYKALGKRVVLTAHNINKRKRDARDSVFNRLTLKAQYQLCDHIFVHTEQMKSELVTEFDGCASAITVIPYGINNALPNTKLTSREAKERLGIGQEERVLLFFGRIVPYKGLEYLVDAFQKLLAKCNSYRLIIAGRPDNDTKEYYKAIHGKIVKEGNRERVLLKIEYVPDGEAEIYFKAADVLVLPYRQIYQSGVLFLAYSFGLPVVASEVGGLPNEIIEGETGFICKPENSDHLADAIERYFKSDMYGNLDSRRRKLREYAWQRYSWEVVGKITVDIYGKLYSSGHMPLVNRES